MSIISFRENESNRWYINNNGSNNNNGNNNIIIIIIIKIMIIKKIHYEDFEHWNIFFNFKI